MSSRYCIAVDVGGTNVRGAIVLSDGSILKRHKVSASNKHLDAIYSVIDALSGSYSGEFVAISLAVAGLIDTNQGVVIQSPNIPALNSVNLTKLLTDRYNCKVLICNDANAATLGEYFAGAGRGLQTFCLITLGTGIGGGVVYQGRLMDIFAEVGHMSINMDGNQCACGNIGCLETYASATAIVNKTIGELEKGTLSRLKDLHNGNIYRITTEDIYKMALEGDSLSRGVLRQAGKCLGIGIANLINVFSPQAIILSGGLVGAWQIYVETAISEASRRSLPYLFSNVKIIASSLQDDAGILGASAVAFTQ